MGSITLGKRRLFLKTSIICLILYSVPIESLRTQSRSGSSYAKERRLSFLNHQLSLLGGQVTPELSINSKLYSHHVDKTTGTDEISMVDVPQNSELVVGTDLPKGRLVLECEAEFPVVWVYKGDGVPSMQTNTTSPVGKKGKYSAIAMVGGDEGHVQGKDTGEYICRNTQNPDESVGYYIYVPGKSYFIRRGGLIKLSPNDASLRIPCSVSNPDAKVTILKSNKGYLTCVPNDTMSYNRRTGFTLNLIEDDEANDPAGQYVCMAGINDSYQLAEYSVVRSYENSTLEYNWDDDEEKIIYDDNYSNLGRNENVCEPNPCGKFTLCEAKTNRRTGDPFTCKCQVGFKGQPPRCRSKNLCEKNNPCGPNSICTEDPTRNYPKCACKTNYIGRPPNCRPECERNEDCAANLNCINNTCQNPCLRVCSLDAVCTVQGHVAQCACPFGSAGDPSYGGRCHKIRLPPMQFFPFFGLGPRPRPHRVPNRVKVQLKPATPLFDDSLIQQGSSSAEYYSGEEVRNPCEPWPCGKYSQCTPVGEYAHCKCNAGYVGLPPNCRPECRRDEDCSSTQICTENNCKDPCKNRGKVRCGANANCRGRNHRAECYCPNGFKGDPLIRCYPSSSENSGESSQENNWGSQQRPPNQESGSSSEEERPNKQPPSTQRPVSKPKPSNPQKPPSNSGCSSEFCGKNALCIQRNNTVTCRCKQGYTAPGSDPYTECLPSRNGPCQKCGPYSICRVMGSNTPQCECQPGKLGSPPNCRDNLCRYNNDCPNDQACYKRACIDPCSRSRCGQFATCKGINHFAVCACPNDPDKDPIEDGGCPPPPGSKSKVRLPVYFPPTRFFI